MIINDTTIKECLIKSIIAGLCWGVGLSVFLGMMVTFSLWWENTYNGIEKADREDQELKCYKILDKESCEKLFDSDK